MDRLAVTTLVAVGLLFVQNPDTANTPDQSTQAQSKAKKTEERQQRKSSADPGATKKKLPAPKPRTPVVPPDPTLPTGKDKPPVREKTP
jgi:hypothetical protein